MTAYTITTSRHLLLSQNTNTSTTTALRHLHCCHFGMPPFITARDEHPPSSLLLDTCHRCPETLYHCCQCPILCNRHHGHCHGALSTSAIARNPLLPLLLGTLHHHYSSAPTSIATPIKRPTVYTIVHPYYHHHHYCCSAPSTISWHSWRSPLLGRTGNLKIFSNTMV